MGRSRLRLALVLSFGLICGWLDPVARFFGEHHWREEAVRASCTELDGLSPFQAWERNLGRPVERHSVAECIREDIFAYVPMGQNTWAHVRGDHALGIARTWRPALMEPAAEVARAEHATVAQRVWHGLFRLTQWVSSGDVGPKDVMVWDLIATATLSCLLAMLLVGLTLRRFAPARDPVVAV